MIKGGNNSIPLIEQFKLAIKEEVFIYQSLVEYLGISDVGEFEEKSEKLLRNLKDKSTLTYKNKFREFLETISHLWEIRQSKKEIKRKVEYLFLILKKDIQSVFSGEEIFHIFQHNKSIFILLILLNQNILSVETMIKSIDLSNHKSWNIIKFFYPEIRKHNKKYFNELMKKNYNRYKIKQFVEQNDQNLELFYEIRIEGKKESKIVELIREDKIEEFISYIEHFPIDLNEKIPKEKTIFDREINEFTPIEYSALFGSIAIFKYLYLKNVKITFEEYYSNIIEYAIHGRSYEIIHLLEERKDVINELNKQKNQHKYLELSIKLHHDEIIEYLIYNYNYKVTEEIINKIIIYRNYQLFDQLIEKNQIEITDEKIMANIFSCFCKNGNEEIVEILINQPNLDINSKDKIFDQ